MYKLYVILMLISVIIARYAYAQSANTLTSNIIINISNNSSSNNSLILNISIKPTLKSLISISNSPIGTNISISSSISNLNDLIDSIDQSNSSLLKSLSYYIEELYNYSNLSSYNIYNKVRLIKKLNIQNRAQGKQLYLIRSYDNSSYIDIAKGYYNHNRLERISILHINESKIVASNYADISIDRTYKDVDIPIIINSSIPLKQIYANFNTQLNNISINVSIIRYSNFNINKKKVDYLIYINKSFSDSLVSNVTYYFTVNSSFIDKLNISPYQIALYKYNEANGSWYPLKTYLVRNSSGSYLYKAYSDSFSLYAVSYIANYTIDNSSQLTASVKLPSNYKLYICAAGTSWAFNDTSLYPAPSWSSNVIVNAPNASFSTKKVNASIGISNSNICSASQINKGFYYGLTIGGIALNYTKFNLYTNSSSNTYTATLNYNVADNGSFVVIVEANGYFNINSYPTLPKGCSSVVNATGNYSNVNIITCSNQAAGSYSLTFSNSMSFFIPPISFALAAFVFNPYKVTFEDSPNDGSIIVNNTALSDGSSLDLIGTAQIKASPNKGYFFEYWSSSNNNITIQNPDSIITNITLDGNGSIIAHYGKVAAVTHFIESGLPTNTLWNITYANITNQSTSNEINISTASTGNFLFITHKVLTTQATYAPNISSGYLLTNSTQYINYKAVSYKLKIVTEPSNATVTINNVNYKNGSIISASGILSIAANLPSGFTFNRWILSNSSNATINNSYSPKAKLGILGNLTLMLNVYKAFNVSYIASNKSANSRTLSLTLNNKYKLYICSGAAANPISSVSWSLSSNSSAQTSIGAQKANICKISATGKGLSLSGLALNYTDYKSFNASSSSGTAAVNYNVINNNSFVVIALSYSYNASLVALNYNIPNNCKIVTFNNNTAGNGYTYGTAIAVCQRVQKGTYNAGVYYLYCYFGSCYSSVDVFVFSSYKVNIVTIPNNLNISINGETLSNNSNIYLIGSGQIYVYPLNNYIFHSWNASNTNLSILSSTSNPAELTVKGNSTLYAIDYALIKFIENGLPAGTNWSVLIKNSTSQFSNASTSNVITFNELPVLYDFSVSNVSSNGYTYVPYPSNGNFLAPNTINILFKKFVCSISLSNSIIAFNNVLPDRYINSSNIETIQNTGTVNGSILINGSSWIYQNLSVAFGVSNTSYEYNKTKGFISLSNTLSKIENLTPSSYLNLLFRLHVPPATREGSIKQSITVYISC
ncbi:MAG: hypothetical protein ARM1_0729 [Candidatus Micrarchaeota archaeon]|nr:MAG: hypothetical protein ARM1_0729 [Candidatus Micrarchaeota archaeon]